MKIQKKYIIVTILVLTVLVITWGDNFNYKNEYNSFDFNIEYFTNYKELKDEYINKKANNLSTYNLKYVAKEVNDIEFLRFILERENINETDRIEYLESLLNLYMFEEDYVKAKNLAYSLKDDSKYYNIYRSNVFIYEKLIDIYFYENDKDNMIILFEELTGLETNMVSELSKESLKKIIELIDDDKVTEKILNKQIQRIEKDKEINLWDLVFTLDITGYDSNEMKNIIYIGEKINSEESNSDWRIESFIKRYPLLEDEKYVYMDRYILITEKENKYIIRYYNHYDEKIEEQETVEKPVSYKVYDDINFIIKNNGSNQILLEYGDKSVVKEKIRGKILDIEIVDDVVVEESAISSKDLDISIDIRGELEEKKIDLEDYMAYEIIKFKKEGKITDVIIKEYRVLETGYLEFVNMKKIISY